jgi:hypothetical protein
MSGKYAASPLTNVRVKNYAAFSSFFLKVNSEFGPKIFANSFNILPKSFSKFTENSKMTYSASGNLFIQ